MHMDYVVQPGDTMWLIARRFGVRLEDLIAANPQIPHPDRLVPGQVVHVPVAVPPPIVRTYVPYTYEVMAEDANHLLAKYNFLQQEVAGYSVLGRELRVFRLGWGGRVAFYNASHHANEWINSPVLMKFVEDYCAAYVAGRSLRGFDIRTLANTASIYVMPMVNPDGVDLVINGLVPGHPFYNDLLRWNHHSYDFRGWKANMHGVDLNLQYNAGWEEAARAGEPGPAPGGYAGPGPESEPESHAVADFTRSHRPGLAIAYHTQGRVIYWDYKNLAPPQSEGIAWRFNYYSGYTPVGYNPAEAENAGYKDWFVLSFRRPGFTIETGLGVNPLPLSQFDEIYAENLGILLYGATVA